MGQEQSAIDAWYHHWVREGFEALEALIEPGPYACGATVSLADLCLVPQVYNARRLKVPLDAFPEFFPSRLPALRSPPSTEPARNSRLMPEYRRSGHRSLRNHTLVTIRRLDRRNGQERVSGRS